MEKTETRNPGHFWIGVIGASALGIVILVGVVMQLRSGKAETARTQSAKTQAAVRTATAKPQAAVKSPVAAKPAATVKPDANVKPQAAAKPQTAAKPEPARPEATPLTDAERKTSEALWVEQRKLQTDAARVVAAAPDNRRHLTAMLAKHFNVPEKLVNDLRGRNVAFGEMTVALALSQQLTKREKLTQQQAVERVLGLRQSGQGWAAIAKRLNLKLGDVIGHVQAIDSRVARLEAAKAKAAKS